MSKRAVLSLGLLLVPLLVSAGFDRFGLTGIALESRGFTVTLYSILRALSALLLIACLLSAGRIARRFLIRDRAPDRSVSELILDFGIGAALISLLVFIVGFAGGLYRAAAWAVMCPLLAALPYVYEGATSWRQVWRESPFQLRLLTLLNVAASIFVLLYRGLYPVEIDGDVWEHYLHYFHEITQERHSLWPGELWYQFYLSKGATLQTLLTLQSDLLAPQLVSWCFLVLAAAVAYDLTRHIAGSKAWGLVASLGVIGSATLFHAVPNLMKLHLVFSGLVAFTAWCAVRIAGAETSRSLTAGAALIAFCAAVYLPVGGGILVAALAAASLVASFRAGTRAVRQLALIAAAALAGTGSVLLLNYGVTGLALDSPLGVFWPHADLSRFSQVWSPLVLEYWFIGTGAVESASPSVVAALKPNSTWLAEVLRLKFVSPFFVILAVAGILAAARWLVARQQIDWRNHGKIVGALLTLLAFLAGTLPFANVFPGSDSVYRLFAFCLPLVIVLAIAAAAALSELAFARGPAAALLPLAAAVYVSLSLLKSVSGDRIREVIKYVWGQSSMRDILAQADTYSGLPGRFADFLEARRSAPDKRMLYMGYSPSPGYLLPLPPLMTEPSYSFGPHYGEILYGDAEVGRRSLKEQGVDYFLINMRSRLFLGIPYSPLFDARAITRRLGLHWSRGEFYLLTWREDAAQPLPREFIVMLEFKQRSIFAKLKEELPGRVAAEKPASYREALATLRRYLDGRLQTAEAREFVAVLVAKEARRTFRLDKSDTRRTAEQLGSALLEHAKAAWGEQIAMDMWNLRLSEDIQSQDFGWLYERNRARYVASQGVRHR